jgi:hypothetical protein
MRIYEVTERTTAYNSGLAKVAVQTSVLRINICAKNPATAPSLKPLCGI